MRIIVSVPDSSQDRIEREIQIDAPIERVFRLVSEPGWFIGDGEPGKTTATREGDVFVVDFLPSAERRAAAYEGNVEGWEMQLAFAKRDAESG
jgi:uncharacterized protein YndB with AHSA1/START domain